MATGPTLPPQAYTREILTAAFNWLQTQPESAKKLATNPDALVGLYLRAQRYGNSNLETDAPVSSQVFMNDLKNLAEGLKQFEENEGKSGSAPSGAPVQASMLKSYATKSSTFGNAPSANSSGANGANPFVLGFSLSSVKSQSPESASSTQLGMPLSYSAPAATTAPSAPIPISNSQSNSNSLQAPPPPPAAPSASVGPLPLNERSQQMIQEVKAALNLSSDAEAVNMMLALAYKNLKNLLA